MRRDKAAGFLDLLFDLPDRVEILQFETHVEMRINAFGLGPWVYPDIVDGYQEALRAASVSGRLLVVVDSPGGTVQGCFEACHDIQVARAENSDVTVTLYSEGMICSAMYALTSAMTSGDADEIVTTSTAETGSCGVVSSWWDERGFLEQMGSKVQYFAYPAGKADGRLGTALSPDAAAKMQADVEEIFGFFADVVTTSRGLSLDELVALDADCFLGKSAVANGLVDRLVPSFATLLAEFDAAPEETLEPAPSDEPNEEPTVPDDDDNIPEAAKDISEGCAVDTIDEPTPGVSGESSNMDDQLQALNTQLVSALLDARPDLSEEFRAELAKHSPDTVRGLLAAHPAAKAKAAVITTVVPVVPEAQGQLPPVSGQLSDDAKRVMDRGLRAVALKPETLKRCTYDASTHEFVVR